jgi:hypothetical protein
LQRREFPQIGPLTAFPETVEFAEISTTQPDTRPFACTLA